MRGLLGTVRAAPGPAPYDRLLTFVKQTLD
jgi:hypothetical protein